jgi:hypothetical protein
LNSIKLLADFIKKIHEHAVEEMKKHFKSKDAETAAVAIADPKDESATKDVTEDSNSRLVEESEIRFVVSYPDNQNGDYKIKMKNAFEMAGIIGPSDPEERLVFITDSEATAYSCTVDEKVNYSKEPYIVCDIGGTVFGISTLKVFELSETGTVEAQIDQSSGECGSIKLDINMRKYLESKISASDEKDLDKLKLVQNRVFDFFDEQIKVIILINKHFNKKKKKNLTMSHKL